jgi:bifunctional non-homologous end joining protein LigD
VSLLEYRRKRRFDRTREPAPGAVAAPGGRPLFVVQLHHARRRHYDVRLQVGDVLRSWAVPKGPSYDPAVKRLAVEVEDHPLDYADFEGDIPKGQYGGGHVAIYDRGTWATDHDPHAQLAKGHLRFELFGRRLVGGWHLVRTGRRGAKPQWLLFKDDDAHAGPLEADDLLAEGVEPPRPTPATAPHSRARRDGWADAALALPGARKAALAETPFAPQLAVAGTSPPTGAHWLHEIKWDGYRILAIVDGPRVRLWSRNALEWTGKAPEVAAALAELGLARAAFDGELIAGGGRRGEFNHLQATLAGERRDPLSLVLFDLLHIDGVDVSAAPLLARKQLLARVLSPPPRRLSYSTHVPEDGGEALALASSQGFEGILSKRADRPYRAGRSNDWRKSKCVESDEFAVVGCTPPKGHRTGFGALLLARPDGQGGYDYAGRVGSGFPEDLIRRLSRMVERRGQSAPTVRVSPDEPGLRGARWFPPAFVVEVFYRGIGGRGLLRQPSLKAVRLDKAPADLTGDVAAPIPSNTHGTRTGGRMKPQSPPSQRTPRSRGNNSERDAAADSGRIVLTHPDRVVFAEGARTKRDVFDYYRAMMDWLLPEIVDRPLSIVRCPHGVARPCFFQKHHAAGLAHTDAVRVEETGGAADHLVVRDADAVLELVQLNAIEFHPWGARTDDIDRADRMVFDLDPDSGIAWVEVVDAARRIRDLLRDLGLQSFVRTSGGKGLHVVVPLDPGCDWETTRRFSRAFAESLVAMAPLRFVATASKRFRKGKIFIDHLRNARGATSVASFSLRARPSATVAMPLRWEELGRIDSAAHFDIASAPRRVRRLRGHPWGDFGSLRQNLDTALDALA